MTAEKREWRAKTKKVMSPEKFLRLVEKIEHPLLLQWTMRDRALVITLYLTAARVGEIARHGFLGTGKSGILKEDITQTNRNGRVFRVFQIRNLKNQQRRFKQVPVAEDDVIDGKLLALLDEYLKPLGEKEVLFPISTRRVWDIVNKYMKISPHYFRHMRLTHLARKRGLSEWELMSVAGWSGPQPARYYIHDDPSRLFDKL